MNGTGNIEVFQKMLDQRDNKRKELEAQLDEIEKEIQSIQHTRSLFMKEHGIPEFSPAPLLEHGLSLTKKRQRALIEWAERNKGVLIPKTAKNTLIANGLLKSGRGASWIIYGTINNMECWEKIKPGMYQLVNTTGIYLGRTSKLSPQ